MSYPSFANPYAPTTAISGQNAQRQQHITELISQISAAVPKNYDRSVYEVSFTLGSGKAAALEVTLPPGFPQERPLLKLQPAVPDPWVEPSGHVLFDDLRRWQHPHTRLAPAASGGAHASPPPPPPPPNPAEGPPRPPAIPVPSEFPAIDAMGVEELTKILLDPKAYEELFREELRKAGAGTALEERAARNAQLAQENLDMESKFVEFKNHIAIVRSSEYGATKQAFDERVARLSEAAAALKPDKFLEALERRGAELEEQSEDLFARFMSEDLAVGDFVDQYLKIRTEVNERLHRHQAAQVGNLLWGPGCPAGSCGGEP
uniref:ESCRT-I complex subunit VPS37 n=1 Tax=Tetraselmis sp. GSL018 TaxID=582737 RepID=A0A061S1I7_9CHLO